MQDSLDELKKLIKKESSYLLLVGDEQDTEIRRRAVYALVRAAEQGAVRARDLVRTENPFRPSSPIIYEIDESPITITEIAPLVVRIQIQLMIPRRTRFSSDVKRYYEMLYYEPLREFFATHPIAEATEPIVLWYRHCYADIHERSVMDHDNLETKLMTDMITHFLAVDDAPDQISTYVSASESAPTRTEILICPKSEFPFLLTSDA